MTGAMFLGKLAEIPDAEVIAGADGDGKSPARWRVAHTDSW